MLFIAGIREVTQGSHDVSLVRDIRDAGGAIGPVDGQNPELHNLTYGLSFANHGDLVFLTTDGISDNYDPVVTKIAVAMLNSVDDNHNDDSDRGQSLGQWATASDMSLDGKPEMEPKERHIYAMKEMERVVHEYELVTEEQCSAQEICSAMVQHVLKLTDQKRKVLENPDLYRRKRLSEKDKKKRDTEIVSKMSEAPGKLDHASIVAYEVGNWRPNEDLMDSIPLDWNSESSGSSRHSTIYDNVTYPKSPTSPSRSSHVLSPGSSSKKIRPKKLFNKLRTNLSIGSNPSSPTTEDAPSISNVASPKRFSFKRSRTKSEGTGALSPSTPNRPAEIRDIRSPPYEGFRFPVSPMIHSGATSPGSHTDGLPIPPQHHPYRKSIAFESAV